MQTQHSARQSTVYNTNNYQSDRASTAVRPYFERRLDRQKFALLVPLFLLLLIGAIYRQRSWASWMPQIPDGSVSTPFEDISPPDLGSSQSDENSDSATTPENDSDTAPSDTVFSDGALLEGIAVQIGGQDALKTDAERSITPTPTVAHQYNTIQPLPSYGKKDQAPAMPVTLSKPAQGQQITQNEATFFQGTAAAGSTVIVNHGQSTGRRADGLTVYQTRTIGEVQAGADGRWQLSIPAPLPPGEHQLSVTQIDEQNGMQTTFTPINFTVLGAGQSIQTALVFPVINSPQTASRLSASCAGSSTRRFNGTAMPGWIIQLLLNEQIVGETRVGINKSWEIALDLPLSAGSYIGRVLLLSPGGEIASESSPVALAIYPCQ